MEMETPVLRGWTKFDIYLFFEINEVFLMVNNQLVG